MQDFVIVLGNNPNDAEKMLNAMFQASSMNSASKSIEKKDSKFTKKDDHFRFSHHLNNACVEKLLVFRGNEYTKCFYNMNSF